LVESTGGGVLVKPGDPAALANGLDRLLADAGERTRLGDAGRRAVTDRYTAAEMARATEAYLANILSPTLSAV
jgi:glycosyltransferase involved in cell wall biosynthesis